MNLIIHAPNVHQGGGRTLLLSLLSALGQRSCTVILDERMDVPQDVPSGIAFARVRPTLWGRLMAEWHLHRLASKKDVVLCFGNLPPLFSNSGSVSVFLQNRYLLLRNGIPDLPFKQALRILIERFWLRFFLRDIKLIVQTPSMAFESAGVLGRHPHVLPFVAQTNEGVSRESKLCEYDFIYVASGEPHKNHRTLIEAWVLLAKEGLRPSLALTLDPDSAQPLLAWIRSLSVQHGLDVVNLGLLDSGELLKHYGSAKAMIYPSCLESFGLPLIEASHVGLPILAAELDYVRDVCDPVETFAPNSPVSIARAVRRFLNKPDEPVIPISPEQFLRSLIET